MVLVDTSVWVERFRRRVREIETLLADGAVACHPFVVGELACGNLRNRREILSLLRALPAAPEVAHEELLQFVETHRLAGRGLGLIDVHLRAAALLSGMPLWTLDLRLRKAAGIIHGAHP